MTFLTTLLPPSVEKRKKKKYGVPGIAAWGDAISKRKFQALKP